MLFNSYLFIFCFLPLTVTGYFLLCRFRLVRLARFYLVLASLFFYGYWNPAYLPLLLGSIIVNHATAHMLQRAQGRQGKLLLVGGIAFNVGLLGFFKYFNFFIENINLAFRAQLDFWQIVLPLAISFFTFQQIAYLVDVWRKQCVSRDFLTYALFVSFFPQLIAGPIVHHSEMMPQFNRLRNSVLSWKNLSMGLYIFFIGLFKKTVIADTLAVWADKGFTQAGSLDLLSSWVAALSYTFQLYYDFSGYTDMAIGSALMLNIKLPVNFNSPYKSLSIREFWARWHITLSRFLRDYVYIPLGGNRHGRARTCRNLLLTFLIGGIWHGAGWTFVVWGALHGAGILVHRFWSGFDRASSRRLPAPLAWLMTFVFVVAGWVFFRATSLHEAMELLVGMVGGRGVVLPAFLQGSLGFLGEVGVAFGNMFQEIAPGRMDMLQMSFMLFLALALAVASRNSIQLLARFRPTPAVAVFAAVVTVTALLFANNPSVFLYFQF